ncbi:MAG: AAA family ATPase [Patescibacteria group bacterium]
MDAFPQIIGHKVAQDVLLRMVKNERIPHAILFVGPSHVGKTHLATALIQYLNQTTKPLSALSDVSVLVRGTDPKTKKRKSAISVKQVRALIERLSMSSMDGSWKIGFVQEADRLSTGAANALLKTLEEPKGKTLLLLRAPSVESVLPTIASRCQTIRLSPVSKADISLALEKRGLGPQEAREIAAQSLGRPGLALKFVNDGAFRARKETAINQARTLLHASLATQFQSVAELIPKQDVDKSHALSQLLQDWSEVVREDLLRLDESTPFNVRVLRRIEEIQSAMRHNVNPHLALEHLFLSTHL